MKISDLDHVVLNVADVERSLAFYAGVLGLQAERLEAFRRGEVKFPSVRINAGTIIDLFPPSMHANGDAGHNMNHLCFACAMPPGQLKGELERSGIAIEETMRQNFGARGLATSYYVRDPDANLIEIRTYEAN